MRVREVLFRVYRHHLRRALRTGPLPRHLAIIIDGNRRWARQMGYDNPSVGHRYGAEHMDELLGWCGEAGITHVTIYVCSIDNLRKRNEIEVAYLMRLIEDVVEQRITARAGTWQLHLAGHPDVLPDTTRHALKRAIDATAEVQARFHLTVAIGYDGRQEIVDAVRSLLETEAHMGTPIRALASRVTEHDIADHLYTRGQPDPDIVIRTSGERRMSGFLLWQSAQAELYFCDVYWPGFREVDFLRALRAYAARRRRIT
ncbi:MAG TPA: polyprenyl diphosphate synthase [Micromonosporaceae bacterium]|jgi:short-chain Z-isoprenyl diphosphate synthase